MNRRWTIPEIPRKGWVLLDVIDVRTDDDYATETGYATCMMCQNDRIRYIHILSHPDIDKEYHVGCICAGNMTDDYLTPKLQEGALKNKTNARIRWQKKQWELTEKGNYMLKYSGRYLLIFRDKRTQKFKCKIARHWGIKSFDALDQAKTAVFEGIQYLKKRGEW